MGYMMGSFEVEGRFADDSLGNRIPGQEREREITYCCG
jgi:hypothetical protein